MIDAYREPDYKAKYEDLLDENQNLHSRITSLEKSLHGKKIVHDMDMQAKFRLGGWIGLVVLAIATNAVAWWAAHSWYKTSADPGHMVACGVLTFLTLGGFVVFTLVKGYE